MIEGEPQQYWLRDQYGDDLSERRYATQVGKLHLQFDTQKVS